MSTFDDELRQIEGLTWLPWIGDNYKAAVSPLILGESHYCYGGNAPVFFESNPEETREVFHDYVKSGRLAGEQYKTYEPMEKVLQNSLVGKKNREELWKYVAFMNLIQSCMDGNTMRPKWELFLSGWQVVLQVINVLRPSVCICFSTDKMLNRVNFNHLEAFKQGLNFDFSIIPNEDTAQRISRCIVAKPGCVCIGKYCCKVIFIRHASRIKGQSVTQWSRIIDSALANK